MPALSKGAFTVVQIYHNTLFQFEFILGLASSSHLHPMFSSVRSIYWGIQMDQCAGGLSMIVIHGSLCSYGWSTLGFGDHFGISFSCHSSFFHNPCFHFAFWIR